MSSKKMRLEAIRAILQTERIANQDELMRRLDACGISVAQATLSRDIRQLKVIKGLNDRGNYVYKLPENPLKSLIKNKSVIPSNIEFSGNLAVMKTKPGYAMGIAGDIDNSASGDILATIAGDDTILIVPKEGVSRDRMIEVLLPFLEQ